MRNIALLLLALLASACMQQNAGKNEKNKDSYVKKNYYDDGSLMSEIPMQDGQIQGTVKNYYASGKLHSKAIYSEGEKTQTIWYYESGGVYRVTPYKDGNMHGIRKFYNRDQSLRAEVPYEHGYPVEGTREYTTSGTVVKKGYPTIQFQQVNELEHNRVVLRFHLSNFAKSVKYYQRSVSNGDTVRKKIPSHDGAGRLTFTVPPGHHIKNRKITVYAETKSSRGHTYVIRGDHYLNVSHRQ
jgi:hypothetical protein